MKRKKYGTTKHLKPNSSQRFYIVKGIQREEKTQCGYLGIRRHEENILFVDSVCGRMTD